MGPQDWLGYLTATLPAGGVVNALGLGALAVLFATNRILTVGQHNSRVADIVKAHVESRAELVRNNAEAIAQQERYHAAIIAEKDRAFAVVEKSRDGYKEATEVERGRADRATDALGEFTELGKLATQLLRSLDEVQKGSKP